MTKENSTSVTNTISIFNCAHIVFCERQIVYADNCQLSTTLIVLLFFDPIPFLFLIISLSRICLIYTYYTYIYSMYICYLNFVFISFAIRVFIDLLVVGFLWRHLKQSEAHKWNRKPPETLYDVQHRYHNEVLLYTTISLRPLPHLFHARTHRSVKKFQVFYGPTYCFIYMKEFLLRSNSILHLFIALDHFHSISKTLKSMHLFITWRGTVCHRI